MKMFIDSNVFIEYSKGKNTAVRLLESVAENNLFINGIVYSEVAYIFLRVSSQQSYFDLKKNKEIVKREGLHFLSTLFPVLSTTKILEINADIIFLANSYLVKYGLLPNDALILATCKYYGIEHLVSLDKDDFEIPCKNEKIRLISDPAALI